MLQVRASNVTLALAWRSTFAALCGSTAGPIAGRFCSRKRSLCITEAPEVERANSNLSTVEQAVLGKPVLLLDGKEHLLWEICKCRMAVARHSKLNSSTSTQPSPLSWAESTVLSCRDCEFQRMAAPVHCACQTFSRVCQAEKFLLQNICRLIHCDSWAHSLESCPVLPGGRPAEQKQASSLAPVHFVLQPLWLASRRRLIVLNAGLNAIIVRSPSPSS